MHHFMFFGQIDATFKKHSHEGLMMGKLNVM